MHLYFLLFPSVWHSGDRLEMPKADYFIDTINGGIDKQLLLNTSNRRFIIWVILARVMGPASANSWNFGCDQSAYELRCLPRPASI